MNEENDVTTKPAPKPKKKRVYATHDQKVAAVFDVIFDLKKVGDVAQRLDVTPQTVKNWLKSPELVLAADRVASQEARDAHAKQFVASFAPAPIISQRKRRWSLRRWIASW